MHDESYENHIGVIKYAVTMHIIVEMHEDIPTTRATRANRHVSYKIYRFAVTNCFAHAYERTIIHRIFLSRILRRNEPGMESPIFTTRTVKHPKENPAGGNLTKMKSDCVSLQ